VDLSYSVLWQLIHPAVEPAHFPDGAPLWLDWRKRPAAITTAVPGLPMAVLRPQHGRIRCAGLTDWLQRQALRPAGQTGGLVFP